MNWMAELYDLYEKNKSIAGKISPDQNVLLPVYHTTVTAQITVTISEKGEFLDARRVDDEEKLTIIPVTEKSASRTSGKEAHPLCDNLEYLAGDYNDYVDEKDCFEKHELYMNLLQDWSDSCFSHVKVRAVYQYLRRGTLIRDLCEKGVLILDKKGKLSTKEKIQKTISQEKSFVRFKIQTDSQIPEDMLEDEKGQYFQECWKDRTLQESYIAYCRSKQKEYGLSYLTGQIMPLAYLHPKKIRNENDGTKLISSNDEKYFTYRGRFQNKTEAFAIGYEDSQKIHNALKWIIRKQGSNLGGLCIVTWESNLQEIPDWQKDSDSICEQAEQDFDESFQEDEEENIGTGEAGATRFQRSLQGYQKNLDLSSNTIILAFDAATQGRLAMVECREYASAVYLKNLERWYKQCEWRHSKSNKERGRYTFIGMVGIRDAAEILYGTEQNGFFSMKGKEECYKDVAKRWLPCILEGKIIPEDMRQLAIRRASSPTYFKDTFLWRRVLELACSMVKQYHKIRFGEEWTMALDERCNRRDYLYGRLLALADRIEYRTYDKDDGRETNAKRYMCAFSQHPFRTWKILEEKLEPYLVRLKSAERLTYQHMMDEIHNKFSIEDYENDTALNGLYLLGFHNQSYMLQKKKDNEEEKS